MDLISPESRKKINHYLWVEIISQVLTKSYSDSAKKSQHIYQLKNNITSTHKSKNYQVKTSKYINDVIISFIFMFYHKW